MYIEHLSISGLKLIRDLQLDFLRDGQPRRWTVLLGENGLCKTTILQAIAMASGGYVRANQMADIPSLPDKRGVEKAKIDAEFSFSRDFHASREYPGLSPRPANPPRIKSWIEISAGYSTASGGSLYEPVPSECNCADPVTEARGRNLPLWFVAGYGTSRMLPRPMSSERLDDPALDRMLPLFDRGRLIGTGFADFLEKPQYFASLLQEALVGSHLLPKAEQVELRGQGGVRSASDLVESHRFGLSIGGNTVKLPATWLSQGYQSSIAWIADLIGQILWEAGGEVPLGKMEGLVLIDEIDLHLHPAWQVHLVPTLKKVFPRMQFVATTHSPMLLPGLEHDELIVLTRDDEGNVITADIDESPALMTGSQLYRTFFGLDRLYPNELGDALHRYGFLAANPVRNDDEEAEMLGLNDMLTRAGVNPGWEPVQRISLESSQNDPR